MAFLYFAVQNGIQNLLRFLGYKATGFFNSWISLKIIILGKKEVCQGLLDILLACRLKRQGLDAKWYWPEKFNCF